MKHLIFALLAVSLLYSCNKPIPAYNPGSFDYKVNGPFTRHVAANQDDMLAIGLQVISGYPENELVQISIDSTPQGISLASYHYSVKLSAGIGDTIYMRSPALGTYQVPVHITSASTGTRNYTYTLIVDSTIDRVKAFLGKKYPSNTCTNTSAYWCFIQRTADTSLRFMMIDSLAGGSYDTVYAVADNYKPTFIIPSQSVHGNTVSGYGSVSYSGIRVYKTLITSSGTYNCSYTLF